MARLVNGIYQALATARACSSGRVCQPPPFAATTETGFSLVWNRRFALELEGYAQAGGG
jgi:hypothetical protein